MAILFVHGAGGYHDDQVIAAALREGTGTDVRMPELDAADMTHPTQSAQVLAHLAEDVTTVVGHSFGGSTVLKLLTERTVDVDRVIVLAAPDWSPDGWDVPDYALPAAAAATIQPGLSIELHHCVDDEIVPIDHLSLLAAQLPEATVRQHEAGGHQFSGAAIADIAGTLSER